MNIFYGIFHSQVFLGFTNKTNKLNNKNIMIRKRQQKGSTNPISMARFSRNKGCRNKGYTKTVSRASLLGRVIPPHKPPEN
jgi:hypothetical protein